MSETSKKNHRDTRMVCPCCKSKEFILIFEITKRIFNSEMIEDGLIRKEIGFQCRVCTIPLNQSQLEEAPR